MNEFTPVFLALTVAFYAVAMRRLATAAQPLRERLAVIGERLVARDDLPTAVRWRVQNALEHAFARKLDLLVQLVALPFVVLILCVFPRLMRDFRASIEISDPDAAASFDSLMRLDDRITMANHPILYGLRQAEFVLCTPLIMITSAVLYGTLSEPAPREDRFEVIALIEDRERRLLRRGAKTRAA